jgi:hypothetical protein
VSDAKTESQEWREILTHMLGAGKHVPRASRGYRNRFCTKVGSSDDETLQQMMNAGLVQTGCRINDVPLQYYHATVAGCEFIGMSKAATKRAMEGM